MAVKAINIPGLLILQYNKKKKVIEDKILVPNSQISIYEAAQHHSPPETPSQVPFHSLTTTPVPSSSSPSIRPSLSRSSQQNTASSGSTSTQEAKRPHHIKEPSRLRPIKKAFSILITGREKSRRPIRANDIQSALQNIQERFLNKAEAEEIKTFISQVLKDSMHAVHYNSLNENFKKRLFYLNSGYILLRSQRISQEKTQDKDFNKQNIMSILTSL